MSWPPLPPRRPSPAAVWVIADSLRAVDDAYAAIDSALSERPGWQLVISVPASDVPALRRRLPHETVTARPGALGLKWALRRSRPGLVIELGAGGIAASAPGVPILRFADGGAVSRDAILARLSEAPAPASGRSGLAAAMVRLTAGRPLTTIDELGDRLGRPATLLCLGNGPSSEDPALGGLTYDCLFRVNWIWRRRGLFTAPDVVFTADGDLPIPSRPILCFPQRHAGLPILLRHVLALKPPRSYMFLDRLPGLADELAGASIPTNGALMVAVAAALRPRRIVIAGIDLYSHAAGRYPGDSEAVDGYSRQHSRDRDLALIRRSLRDYQGEVRIFGGSLEAALRA